MLHPLKHSLTLIHFSVTKYCTPHEFQFLLDIYKAKRNAAYGSFTNLSQMICHSLSADSWILSLWDCPSCHCHRTKMIGQLRPTVLSILTPRHYTVTTVERPRSDIVPIRQKRFLRLSFVHAWHRNCWGINDGVTLACNIPIPLRVQQDIGIVN